MKNFVNLLAKDKIIREFCLSLVSIANVLENVDVKVVSTRLAGTAIIILYILHIRTIYLLPALFKMKFVLL